MSGPPDFQFIAGNLALDFVNTVAYRADPSRAEDRLARSDDVVRWATQAELPDAEAIRFGPKLSGDGLRRLIAVREQLCAIFHAIAHGELAPSDALARVSTAYHECAGKRRLAKQGEGMQWVWRATARTPDFVLYPVLSAATELLTSHALRRVRQCEDDGCGWLFVDRSNARQRRWCSMADCGNRNKVRNFYRRETSSR